MRLISIMLFVFIFLISCKKEEPCTQPRDYQSKIWSTTTFPFGSVGTSPKFVVNFQTISPNRYELNYQISFMDSSNVTVDSIVGVEEGKIEFDFCRQPVASPLIFSDDGMISFSPEGKDNYVSTFSADNQFFVIDELKLDTFQLKMGFAN